MNDPLTILKYPDPHLQKPTTLVTDFGPSFQEKVEKLKALLVNTPNALAVAANQVGWSEKFFIMKSKKDLVVFVNPMIIGYDNTQEQSTNEGCLSFPDVFVQVSRPIELDIRALNQQGEEFIVVVRDLEAIIVMHEIDHLQGLTFLDVTTRQQKRAALKQMGL